MTDDERPYRSSYLYEDKDAWKPHDIYIYGGCFIVVAAAAVIGLVVLFTYLFNKWC